MIYDMIERRTTNKLCATVNLAEVPALSALPAVGGVPERVDDEAGRGRTGDVRGVDGQLRQHAGRHAATDLLVHSARAPRVGRTVLLLRAVARRLEAVHDARVAVGVPAAPPRAPQPPAWHPEHSRTPAPLEPTYGYILVNSNLYSYS